MIAQRYVSGFTPGVDTKDPSLGGRVAGQAPEQTRWWRSEFMAERGRHGPAGVAEFAFVRENRAPDVVADVMRALERAVTHLA